MSLAPLHSPCQKAILSQVWFIVFPYVLCTSAACGISPSELVVGSARGGLWRVAMEFNDTHIESDVSQLRETDDEEHRIWQIIYGSMTNHKKLSHFRQC